MRATYTLSETPVNSYTSFAPIEGIQGLDDTSVIQIDPTLTTNTYTTVDISGVKTWADYNNAFNTRPAEITIDLLRNDIVIDSTTATADGDWAYSFTNLPELDNTGTAYDYSVEEQAVPADYIATVDGSNITNTLDPKKNEIVKVEGTKTWVDHKDWTGDHPEITVNLLGNGVKVAETTLSTGTANEGTYSFDDLPKYDSDGTEITYAVSEEPVIAATGGGYATTIDGYDITNTWYDNELVTLQVHKQWVDDENAQGTRPDSISVTLHKDGTPIAEATLSTDNGWSAVFEDLPKYRETSKGSSTDLCDYTLEEKAVAGYSATYGIINFTGVFHGESTSVDIVNTASADNSDITTHKPTPLPKDPTGKVGNDSDGKLVGTGDATSTGAMVLIAALALGTAMIAFIKRKRN